MPKRLAGRERDRLTERDLADIRLHLSHPNLRIAMMKLFMVLLFGILQTSAFAIEKMECVGTEPFWGAAIDNRQLVLDLDFAGEKKTYPSPIFKPPAGTNPDYLMSIQAKTKTSRVVAFVAKDNVCSDDMSDRIYPYSIFLMLDENPLRGCCSTASKPPK